MRVKKNDLLILKETFKPSFLNESIGNLRGKLVTSIVNFTIGNTSGFSIKETNLRLPSTVIDIEKTLELREILS